MEQIRVLYRLVATITCLVCLGFSVGMCSNSDGSLIKTYVSPSLLSTNDDLVYSAKLKVKKISGSEWDSLVIKSKDPVMVMFTQDWCDRCRKLALEFADRFNFYTLVIEDELAIAKRYDVQIVPTNIVFKGGEVVAVEYMDFNLGDYMN